MAEVVVLLERRQRTRAMTLRLERHDERWTCTHLHVL
ncbi:Rv3235 family protein [Luedemannella flava]